MIFLLFSLFVGGTSIIAEVEKIQLLSLLKSAFISGFFEFYNRLDRHRTRRRMVMAKGTQYSQQFKEDAVQYRKDHPELTLRKAAENLGISESALKNWMKTAKNNEGKVPSRGSGNYASDEAKEIARLQRELRDTKDALEVLKKAISILGK